MRSFGVTHRANVGCVDPPEHHDQAKPNRKGRYELVVQLEATAKTKDSSLAFVGTRSTRGSQNRGVSVALSGFPSGRA
jgi:hypothetical protein